MTDRDAAAVLNVLGDAYAREILMATTERPRSATELTDSLEMSQPTVSRRVRDLLDLGLLEEETRLDPDGHHHSVYRATIEEATVTIDPDSITVSITGEQTAADRMTYIWNELRGR